MPYLIDGNNLLGSLGGPAAHEDGRGEVVRRVAAFCRARGAQATIVFDGGPLRPDLEAQQMGAVRLRVPPPGRDADSVIREIVETSARPGEITVVTSDKALYGYVKTMGAHAMQAHEWNRAHRQATAPAPAPGAALPGEKPERETNVEGWLRVFGETTESHRGTEDPEGKKPTPPGKRGAKPR